MTGSLCLFACFHYELNKAVQSDIKDNVYPQSAACVFVERWNSTLYIASIASLPPIGTCWLFTPTYAPAPIFHLHLRYHASGSSERSIAMLTLFNARKTFLFVMAFHFSLRWSFPIADRVRTVQHISTQLALDGTALRTRFVIQTSRANQSCRSWFCTNS